MESRSSFLGPLKEPCGLTASSFGLSSKRSPLLKTKRCRQVAPKWAQLLSKGSIFERRKTPSGRTVPPSLMCTSAPSHAGWAAGSGASCGGPASASRGGRPDGGRHLLLRRCGLLCWTKARHFQALPPARSALSRELRRKGPVCCELRRGLATSEACRVRYYSRYCQYSAKGGTNPRREYCPVHDSGRRCARAGTSSAPLRWPTRPKRTHKQTQNAP